MLGDRATTSAPAGVVRWMEGDTTTAGVADVATLDNSTEAGAVDVSFA